MSSAVDPKSLFRSNTNTATARLGSSCSERVGANENNSGTFGQSKVYQPNNFGAKFSMNNLGFDTMSAKGEVTLMNDGTTLESASLKNFKKGEKKPREYL